MNQFYLDVRSKEKLKELRREGILSQEFHRLGGKARPVHQSSATLMALTVVLLGVILILAL